MRKYGVVAGAVVILSIVALSMASLTVNQKADDSDSGNLLSASAQGQVTPVPAPGQVKLSAAASASQRVWFAPQDLTTNTTVLIFDNMTGQSVTIDVAVYDAVGSKLNEVSIDLGAGLQTRLCSDPIVSAEGVWQGALYVNFMASAATGLISLPAGVVVDGYVAWSGGSGTFDPGAAVPVLPLRFVTVQ